MNLFNGKSYYYVKLKEDIKTKLVYIPINVNNKQWAYVYLMNVSDHNGTHVSTIQQTENIYFVKDKEENGYTYFDVHLHVPVLHAPLGSEYRYNYEISRLRLLKDLPSGVSSFNEILSMVDEYLGFDFVDESGQTVSWAMEGTYSNTLDIIQYPKDDSGNTLDIDFTMHFPSADVIYDYYIFTNSIRIKVNGINVAPKNIVVKDYWSNAVDPSYFITQIDANQKSESITRVKNSSIIVHMLPDVYYNDITQRPGTDFHFIDKSITVDSAASEKDVRFYWDGLLTDLSILSFSGFPSTSYITLPTELKDDCIYTLKAKFDQNTGSSKKNYSVTIVKRSDPNIHDSFTAVQNNIILPETVFYWEQSSYSIEFYEDYIEAVLHYNDHLGGTPFDKLIITDESTYKDFSLPNVYNEDGIYRIRFNIGPNLDYETKSYTVVLKEKTTRNKQSVRLNIAAKQSPQLFWNPDSLTINHDQESIQVNYYWTNFQGGDPSHFLMMSSDIPGFVPYLPDTVSSNNNYTFVINLGANTGLAPRNYTVTVRSSDKFYSSVLHIMQYGTGGDAYFTYYFEKQNIIAPASGYVPQGYISNKLIGSLTSLTGEFDIISIPYWIKKENIRFDKTSGLLIIDKEDPNVFAERTGKIQILFYSEDGKTYAAEFTVTQEAGQIDSTNISPIWRDTWINIDADYNYFRLVNKNTKEIYFNGQTIKNELAQFKLNNVISDYMNVWGSFGSSLQNGNNFNTSPVEISVSCSKNGSDFDYTLPDTYKFIWDYSYDKHVSGILFNGNIINYYDPRQKIMISSSNRSNNEMITKVETIFANNDKSTIEEYTLLPGEMHATFVPAYSGPGDGAVKIKVSCTVQGKTEVKEYVPKCTKANYVLHYVNRYGQVCWMLFAGKQIKSDKITSSKFVQAYDNNYRYNFENVVYQNKVEESWQLTTSYLTDKQSNDLTDLYSSPIVFLEDLNADNTDNIIAVTVETKSVDYKNYKNQGKFFTHTIKVQNAQNKFILL